MTDLVIFGLICFGIGFVTAVFSIVTIIFKAMRMLKPKIRPPKIGGF